MKYWIKTLKQNKVFHQIIHVNVQVYAYYKNSLMFSAFNSSKNAFFMLRCGTLSVASLEGFINHPVEYIQIQEWDVSSQTGPNFSYYYLYRI